MTTSESLEFLAEAGKVLAESLDYETTLDAVARLVIPRFADWSSVYLPDDAGILRRTSTAHADPAKVSLVNRMKSGSSAAPPGVQAVYDRGEPYLARVIPPEVFADPSMDESWREALGSLGLRSAIMVPLAARGHSLGVMNFSMAESGRLFDDVDLALARELSYRIALAVDNARLQRELRRTRDILQKALDTLTNHVSVQDASGRILFANEAQAWHLGFASQAEMLAVPVERLADKVEVFREDGTLLPTSEFASVIARRGKTASERMVRVVRKDTGEGRWFMVQAAPILDGNGAVDLVVTSGHDVTRLKEADEKLRQSQKMEAIGQLAGGIAHDFNNLLTAINGFSDLLLTDASGNGEYRGLVSEIRQAGERASGLTRQLLAYSRRQILTPKQVDLNEVVSRMTSMLGRIIGEHIHLVARPAEALLPVRVDPGQFEQVVLNLTVNARDAMPDGGTLSISTSNRALASALEAFDGSVPPGRYVELSITDTGTGMGEDVKARLFEPFFTTKEVGKGTGLGLSMVLGIVKQSEGYIQVESEPGKGSTFRIFLPAASGAAEPGRREPGSPGRASETGGGGTVLLVEDEEPVRRFVRHILRGAGYDVVEACTGYEGLQKGGEHEGEISLLLTDVVMPGLTGPKLAEALGRLRPGLRTLFVSGYTDTAVLKLEQGAPNFLQKPFSPADLLRKVKETMVSQAA